MFDNQQINVTEVEFSGMANCDRTSPTTSNNLANLTYAFVTRYLSDRVK